MNPEQWLSLKWNGGSTMSDRWLNQSKIIQHRLEKNIFYIYAFNIMCIFFAKHISFSNGFP